MGGGEGSHTSGRLTSEGIMDFLAFKTEYFSSHWEFLFREVSVSPIRFQPFMCPYSPGSFTI